MKLHSIVPQQNKPIIIIGAGGIVNDAHLPAYQLAGYSVAGIYDVDVNKAKATAQKFKLPRVFQTLDEVLQYTPEEVVYDLALPGSAIAGVLQQLPNKAAVLLQKPMGNNIKEAQQILKITREKEQLAGVNFQLRYAPMVSAARNLINNGIIGELCDIEVNINVYTPWHLWNFLFDLPRVEILYHSIHYVDLVRSFLGNPLSLYSKTVKHPGMSNLASVRTNIIMDYGNFIRANILTNHCHQFGLSHQQSYIKFEGTKGAIKLKLGVLMDYPKGQSDSLEYVTLEEGKEPEWKTLDINGNWFPHAFIGSMAEILKAANGSIALPDNSVEDCIYTMACVEAAYKSSEEGGIKLGEVINYSSLQQLNV